MYTYLLTKDNYISYFEKGTPNDRKYIKPGDLFSNVFIPQLKSFRCIRVLDIKYNSVLVDCSEEYDSRIVAINPKHIMASTSAAHLAIVNIVNDSDIHAYYRYFNDIIKTVEWNFQKSHYIALLSLDDPTVDIRLGDGITVIESGNCYRGILLSIYREYNIELGISSVVFTIDESKKTLSKITSFSTQIEEINSNMYHVKKHEPTAIVLPDVTLLQLIQY